MTQQLTLKPIIKDMLEHAGIEDVYDFAPSARDCACPIVIADETYEQTDLLDDCEYGTVTLDVVAVADTRDACLAKISCIIYALHRAEWEKWSSDALAIRGMSVMGLPEELPRDGSWRWRAKSMLVLDVCVSPGVLKY